MAGYIRQSSFVEGDTITASIFNNEYNQLVNVFSNTGGHKHDGTTAEGPVIGLIGDAGETSPNNKVLIDTTNNYIEFYVEVSSNPVQQLYIADGAIIPVTDSDIDLGTTSLRFKDTYTDTITTTGNVAVGGNLTVTGTTTFNGGTITMGDAATDNVVFGADVDSNIIPDDDNTYDLGSSSQEWKDIYIDGTAYLDAINFNGTAITSTAAELNILDGVTASATDINLIDGITNGTVIASKAIVTDSNKDITGGRNITITGELDAATLDISGDADIDGTLEADAITIGGITLAETISDTVGAMVSSNTETNITVSYDDADNTLDFVIGTLNQDTTGNAATATALETSRTIHGVSFDGTSNIDLSEVIQDTVGAMVSSNTESGITVTYQDDDGTIDFSVASQTDENFTTADHAKLDGIEASATADQTDTEIKTAYENNSNTNAFTDTLLSKLNAIEAGATADQTSEEIQDIVGAMVSSNTESGITVTYQDDDGTIDFSVGTLNQDTTGNAATATALETARTINGVSFDGTGNITTLTAGTGVSVSGTGVSIGQSVATNADTNFATVTTTGNVIVGGNLTVSGTQTTLNTATLDVEDKNITVNKGAGDTSGSADGAGITIQDAVNASTDATMLWSAANDNFVFSHEIVVPSLDISGNVDVDGTLETDALTIGGVTSVPFEAADHSKLDGIESGATGDQTNAEIRAAVEAATDSNVFTDNDHSKLNAIEAGATADQTDEEIQDVVGGMITGNTESGITVTYQDDDGTIDFSVASQTDNNFTTTLKNKLDGIEASATADQSAAEILTAIKTVDGASSGLDADLLDSQEGSYYLDYNNFSNTPTIPTGNITGVTAGVGLSGGGTSGAVTLTLDMSELTDMTADVTAAEDELIILDNGADRRKLISEIPLSAFDNDAGFGSGAGDITAVVAGTGLSGGATSGSATLNVSGLTVSEFAGASIQTGSESFSDSDTVLMTAAAVNDKITSFGYTTNTGDITAVVAGTGLSGGATSGSATLNVSGLTVSELAGSSLTTSSESFADNDTTLMTSASINDRITSFGYTTNTGDITGVTAGTGLSGGGSSGGVTLNVDLSELTDMTAAMVGTDEFIVLDAGADRRKAASEIPLSIFNNDSGFTSNTGDITGVTAGTGLSGGGSSGSVTLNVDLSELTDMTATMVGTDEFIVLDAGADRRKAASEIPLSIFNNDSGFTSNTGDITGVTAGTNLSGGGTSGTVTLNMATGGVGSGTYGSTSDGTKIDTITVDAYGRVTAVATGSTGSTSNTGDITGVTAGTNLNGGGTSGSVTLNVDASPSFTNVTVSSTLDVRGAIDLADSDILRFGTGDDVEFFFDGTNMLTDLNAGSWYVRDGTTSRFLFNDNGDFHADANIFAYSTSVGSDRKLKDNIELIENPLDKIEQLNGVTFNWKKNGEASAGVIAQDVEKVLPSAVKEIKELNGEDETRLNVDYNQIIGLLVESIKELKQEIKGLKGDK